MHRFASRTLAAAILAALGGCGAPTSALSLIAVARQGIQQERQDAAAAHKVLIAQLRTGQAALDAAFDADVKLAAADQVRNAQGKPAALSAEWVISARKGYIAARDAIAAQIAAQQLAEATRQDNLSAADEALRLAGDVIVQQAALGRQVKQYLLSIQRRLIGAEPQDK